MNRDEEGFPLLYAIELLRCDQHCRWSPILGDHDRTLGVLQLAEHAGRMRLKFAQGEYVLGEMQRFHSAPSWSFYRPESRSILARLNRTTSLDSIGWPHYSNSRFANFATSFRFPAFSKKT